MNLGGKDKKGNIKKLASTVGTIACLLSNHFFIKLILCLVFYIYLTFIT